MSRLNIDEKDANFKAWIALINDRIEDWLSNLEPEQKNKFDYTVNSLDEIERYLISKFKLEDLSNQAIKYEIDAICSYVLSVFKNQWPNSEYVIELEDEKNVLFNRPAIITVPKIGMAFSPFQFLASIINLKRVGGFKKMLNYTKNKYNEINKDKVKID